MRGVLLMSFGSVVYGKYAYNMACSIRHYCNIPIHLIHDTDSIQGIDLSVFDSTEFIEFDKEAGRVDPGRAKIKLFERSPFEETLYLDVDGVMLKNPEELFDRLSGNAIWVQPMGSGGKGDNISYTWAPNEIVWKKYKLKEDVVFTSSQTSVIYFEKSAKKFFDKLQKNYSSRLKPEEYREMWGRSQQHPDELYYSVTMAQMEIVPENKSPVFFPEKRETITNILNNYYVLSMYGGNNVKSYAFDLYDRIMLKVMGDRGMNHYYKARNLYKSKFINTK